MKKVLFVSVAFPPKSDAEGLQTAKYFHHLQKHDNLQIDVVTSALPTLNMPFDKSLVPYTTGVHQLVSVNLRENRYVNYLLHKLGLAHTMFPDIKQSFHKQYRKVIHELQDKPDIIYSRADPKSSTILAYKLKKAFQVPWILHMSDPWADCPIQNMQGSNYKKHDLWERKCFEAADIISLTSTLTIAFYKKKYPEYINKFKFFPNVYEASGIELFEKKGTTDFSKKFRIVYTGGLAYERSPEYLLKPLLELYREKPTIANQLEVFFAGDIDSTNRAVFERYKLPFVKQLGILPFKETIKLQQTADYLVLIDSPISDASMSMFFPSKLLDYMMARKRILAITTKGSTSDQVMQDLKGDIFSHDEFAGIKQAIIQAYEAFQRGDENYLENNKPPQKYEASYNAGRLYNQILELIDV